MSKRLEALRANAKGNWKIADVEALCAELGITCKPPTGGGSHYKISYPGIRDIVTIPARRPIKPVYIRRLVSFVETVIKPQ